MTVNPDDQQPHGVGIMLDADRSAIESWLATNTPPGRWPIDTLVPVHHNRQGTEAGAWTAYVIGLRTEAGDAADAQNGDAGPPGDGLAADVLASINTSAETLVRRVDVLRLQPGLDMFYPRTGGAAGAQGMIQTIEYVTSRPETRDDYYTTQYEFSGPAMRRLHDADRVGRFIGFEIVDTLHRVDGIPEHDVIHISGFRLTQGVKAARHFWAAFDAAAAASGRSESGKQIVKNWDTQRTKNQVRVRQLWDRTIAPTN
ncbi:MAG: hypothetical protein AAGA42_03850 [Actinomycetota bacterium]